MVDGCIKNLFEYTNSSWVRYNEYEWKESKEGDHVQKIIWDFHLLLRILMMFSFMLTNSENPIRLCRHCTKAFFANRLIAVFCSSQCKNRYNIYKSHGTNKNKEGDVNA